MKPQIYAWIQNTKTSQSAIVIENGELKVSQDLEERKIIITKLLDAKKGGKQIAQSDNFELYKSGNRGYLIEFPTLEIDDSGRPMTIVILIESFNNKQLDEIKEVVNVSIKNSNYSINKSFIEKAYFLIDKEIKKTKKKIIFGISFLIMLIVGILTILLT